MNVALLMYIALRRLIKKKNYRS